MPQCCVIGCSERTDKKSNRHISFHGFPRRDKSPTRYASWLKMISRADFTTNPKTVVCSRHFEDDNFEVSPVVVQNVTVKPKAALKKCAVPTKLLKGERLENVSNEVIKKRKRDSKFVRKKNLTKIVEGVQSTSGLQQEQMVENINLSSTFSLEAGSIEIQCELGNEVLRRYWQPVESQFGKSIEENTKNFTRKNTDSSLTDLSDSSDENISDAEDSGHGTLNDEINDDRFFLVKRENLKQ